MMPVLVPGLRDHFDSSPPPRLTCLDGRGFDGGGLDGRRLDSREPAGKLRAARPAFWSRLGFLLGVAGLLSAGPGCRLVPIEEFEGGSKVQQPSMDEEDNSVDSGAKTKSSMPGSTDLPKPKKKKKKGDGKSSKDDKKKEKEEIKPEKLELSLRIPGDVSSVSKWRLRFQLTTRDKRGKLKLGKVLYETKIKLKGDLAEVQVPFPEPKQLKKGEIFVVVTIYRDKDKDDAPGEKDEFIASLPGLIHYQSPSEKKKEWQYLPLNEKKSQDIQGALMVIRLDEVMANRQALLSGSRNEVEGNTKAIASVSVREYKDLKGGFSEVPRGVDGVLPADGKLWRAAVGRPMAPERIKEGGPLFPGFSEHAISWLVGHDGKGREDQKLSSKASVTAGVCHKDRPVVLLWIEGKNWVQSVEGAFHAVRLGVRPGWNVVAVEMNKDKKDRSYTVLSEEESSELSIKKKCLVKDPVP